VSGKTAFVAFSFFIFSLFGLAVFPWFNVFSLSLTLFFSFFLLVCGSTCLRSLCQDTRLCVRVGNGGAGFTPDYYSSQSVLRNVSREHSMA